MRDQWVGWRWICCGLLALQLAGCESLQRKLVRKRRKGPPPNPIINFQDYTQAMTPADRYRKHYLMFDYWNDDLMDALQASSVNPKRLQRSSTEALGELSTLQGLLNDQTAQRLAPLIAERVSLNRQLQGPAPNPAQAGSLLRAMEAQARRMDRDFFWRDVKDQLKGTPPAAAD